MQDGNTIYLMQHFNQPPPTPSFFSIYSVNSDTMAGVTHGAGTGDTTPIIVLGANLGPFESDGNTTLGMGLSGVPDFDTIRSQDTLEGLIEIPDVQEDVLYDRGLLRNFVMEDPDLHQLVEQDPDFGHTITDPSSIRQSLEISRNPALKREMNRIMDRSLSNFESSPEGFNMLRRYYQNVQAPLYNLSVSETIENQTMVTSETATMTTESAKNSTTPNTRPLPNPWAYTGE